MPKEDIQRHFIEAFSQTEGVGPLPLPRVSVEPCTKSNNTLVAPLEQSGVLRRLLMKKNYSPWPDGVTYNDFKRADSDAAVLTAL